MTKARLIFLAIMLFLLAQAFVLAVDAPPLGYFDGNAAPLGSTDANLGYFDGN